MESLAVVAHGNLSVSDRAAVMALLRQARAADGRHPLSEEFWHVLERGSPSARAILVSEPEGGRLIGFAPLLQIRDGWSLELVVHPDRRSDADPAGSILLDAALAEARRRGRGHLRYWVRSATAAREKEAAAAGLVLVRTLYQMTLALPLPDAVRASARVIPLRPFRPGADDTAWLEVNNRAFAGHPEQGGWDRPTLEARQAEPWFDPNGFLVYEHDGELWGSCWTKIHRDVDPPQGEIYVISVDPARHAQGLGRALTVAGLDWLAAQGLGVGMLYVDGANEAAVGLYRALGFVVEHADLAYEVTL